MINILSLIPIISLRVSRRETEKAITVKLRASDEGKIVKKNFHLHFGLNYFEGKKEVNIIEKLFTQVASSANYCLLISFLQSEKSERDKCKSGRGKARSKELYLSTFDWFVHSTGFLYVNFSCIYAARLMMKKAVEKVAEIEEWK